MKNKKNLNPFLCSFAVFSVLILLAAAAAVSLFYYIFSIPKPYGLSRASWPQMFTNGFSAWMDFEGGAVQINQTGLSRLDEYGLWLQVLDESGQEIFSYRRPDAYPVHYPASELVSLGTGAYQNGYTVFVSSFQDSEKTCCYLIGFPYAVGKYMLYYDGEKISRLLPAAKSAAVCAIAVFGILIFSYTLWLSRKLSVITGEIQNISRRVYIPRKERGMFCGIFTALNQMDSEIRQSDRIKTETDRVRREWITNITHDLKTPLSPVRGYAELLAGNREEDAQTVQEYAKIILKNVSHAEKLLNDLKLTYQLDSGAAPYHPRRVRLTGYVRELVIDIINDPAFSSRSLEFESSCQEISVCLDPDLFRRALQNIIMNALVHNPPDTSVKISIYRNEQEHVCIAIRDNGRGMDETELARLFERYYRGTSTIEKPEGSGLGLAIAKQIITLHGGTVSVKSQAGCRSEFVISI